jgi:hypothetical protein
MVAEPRPKNWPENPVQMGTSLTRAATPLRAQGYEIDRWHSGKNKIRILRLVKSG